MYKIPSIKIVCDTNAFFKKVNLGFENNEVKLTEKKEVEIPNLTSFLIKFELNSEEISNRDDSEILFELQSKNVKIRFFPKKVGFVVNNEIEYFNFDFTNVIPKLALVIFNNNYYLLNDDKLLTFYYYRSKNLNTFEKIILDSNLTYKNIELFKLNKEILNYQEFKRNYNQEIISSFYEEYKIPFILKENEIIYFEKTDNIDKKKIKIEKDNKFIFKNEKSVFDFLKEKNQKGIYSYYDEEENNIKTTYYEIEDNKIKKLVKLFYDYRELKKYFNPNESGFENFVNFDLFEEADEIKIITKNGDKNIILIEKNDFIINRNDEEFLIEVTKPFLNIDDYDEIILTNSKEMLQEKFEILDDIQLLPKLIGVKNGKAQNIDDTEVVLEFYKIKEI